jgi:membrane fusion protein (multidrug efflux system)
MANGPVVSTFSGREQRVDLLPDRAFGRSTLADGPDRESGADWESAVPVWKQLLILVVLGGLGAGGYWVYNSYGRPVEATEASAEGRAVSVETALAERRTLAHTVEAVGTTRASRSVEIVPLAAGRVVEVNFRTGQRVEAGDVLVRLDDDIERANLAEAEALLVEQRHAVDRMRRLQQSNAIAMAQLEQVTAEFAAAGAALDRAKRRLADREIRAPFTGIVGFTEVDPGARVEEGTVITRIDDLSEVEVEFGLPETLFAEINVGLPVSAGSAAFPDRSFVGRVSAIGTRVDPVSRSFRVRAIIPNSEGALPAGMFMFLSLTLSESEAIVVPEEAVIAQAAETYVYVVDAGRAVRRIVTTGQRHGGVIAILDGVEEGQPVVIRGTQRLRDGAPIKVLNQPETAAATPGRDGT